MYSDLHLETLSAASPYFEAAVRVYTLTWNQDWDEARRFFARYATGGFQDYRGQIALVGGRVVGMGFGVRSQPGYWWHDTIAHHVGSDHPALPDAWALTELAVLPGYRDQGVGGRLHDALMAAQPCARVLLSTELDNRAAQRFYRRHGWRVLHPGFVFRDGQNPYMIMHKETLQSPKGSPFQTTP